MKAPSFVRLLGVGTFLALTAVWISGAAGAVPPRTATITKTAAVNRHVSASWTLPSSVEPFTVEVAKSPQTGSDGSFLSANVVAWEELLPDETSYLSKEQFEPGIYYVQVQTADKDCSWLENSSCYAFSQPVQVMVLKPVNRRPTLGSVRFIPALNDVSVTTCDDSTGTITFRTTLYQTLGGRTTSGRTTYRTNAPIGVDGTPDCSIYTLPMPSRPAGIGRYRLVITATDRHGLTSRPIVRRWFTSD